MRDDRERLRDILEASRASRNTRRTVAMSSTTMNSFSHGCSVTCRLSVRQPGRFHPNFGRGILRFNGQG